MRVLQCQLLGESYHCCLRRFVGDQRIAVLARRHRGNVDDCSAALLAHDRQNVLARHYRAAQIDRTDSIEHLFGELVERFVAAANADPDVVVQDVDAPPAGLSSLDRCS